MSFEQASRTPTSASRQLLLVVVEDWTSTAGRMQRFARAGVDRVWLPVGMPLAVVLGRCGLAWGRGLHPPTGAVTAKLEGDGRAPAGVFALTALFGEGGPDSPLARCAKLPYLAASSEMKAIDDPASAYYNRIVDQSALARPDWTSYEDMLRSDARYAVGAVVGHNCDPVVSGAGSCIFLHVWEAPGAPTAGCTALALADMTEIAGWLDGMAAPVLVQLPRLAYERYQAAWGLPTWVA